MAEERKGVLMIGTEGNPTVASKPKPPLCFNCAENEGAVLTASPTLLGRAGLPLDVWLCASCAAKVPAPPKPPPRRRKNTKGRVTAGRYGTTVMRLAFRYGGFTTRQLGELLLLESPRRFYRGSGFENTDAAQADEEAHARALKSATKAAYKHLSHLREQRLMGAVGVWREHLYGERDGRTESFFHLETPKGAVWGGSLDGEGNDAEAVKGYNRHQIPKRAEHAAYRNDVYLRMLRDIAVERSDHEDLSPQGEDAGYLVLSGPGDFSGESDPSYPYEVGPFRNKLGEETPRRGRTSEWLYPDGVPRFRWADGVECAFDIEAERTSGAVKGAGKLDRYGAYWLRLYKLHEARLKEPERALLAEKLARMEAERRKVREITGKKDMSPSSHPHLLKERFKEVRQAIADIDAREVPFSGLPEGVAPVVFVHPTKTKSANVRRSLQKREYPTPRLDEFLSYLAARMDAWVEGETEATGRGERSAAVGWRGGEKEDYARHVLESLFVFTSWEALQPEVKTNLATGEVYEVEPVGGTLEGVYAPLPGGTEEATSLRATAELRGLLRPEWGAPRPLDPKAGPDGGGGAK